MLEAVPLTTISKKALRLLASRRLKKESGNNVIIAG
jgi:hypothetical protein